MKHYINSSKIYPTARNFQLQMGSRTNMAGRLEMPAQTSKSYMSGYKTYTDFHPNISGNLSINPSHQTSVNFYKEPSNDRTFKHGKL